MTDILKRLAAGRILRLAAQTLPRRLSLLDIGARGGVQWPWDHVDPSLFTVVLVEADAVEAERLREECDRHGGGVVIPSALWRDETVLTLHLNCSPGTSSVFPGNSALLAQFPEFERYETVSTVDLPAQTIDKLAAAGMMPGVDFAKIDVQGAELAILQGGRAHLERNLIGLEVEVEFCEIYSGQPLFADVDPFVRAMGLELWDLRKTYWKYEQGRTIPGAPKGRLVFGDALYFRPIAGFADWLTGMPTSTAKEKAAMLVVAALAYGYVDYAAAIVDDASLTPFLDGATRRGLHTAVMSQGRGFRPFPDGNRVLHLAFDALAKAFKPTYRGWAAAGHGLGSRRRGPFWC